MSREGDTETETTTLIITVWNSLPKTVFNSDSLAVIKSRLKTFLFSQAFPSFSAHEHAACPQHL